MGTESIPTRADSQTINQSWFNIFKSVLTQAMVPRNATGDATDLAGDLGSTTHRWAAAYLQKLFVGAVANAISIEEESANVVVLKIGGTARMRVTTAGIQRTSIAAINAVYSADCPSTSVTSAVDGTPARTLISNIDITITTTGRPVMLLARRPNGGGGASVSCEQNQTGAAGSSVMAVGIAALSIWRGNPADYPNNSGALVPCGGRSAHMTRASLKIDSSAWTFNEQTSMGAGFFGLDLPPAGQHRYFGTLEASNGSSVKATTSGWQLAAVELL